MLLRTAQAILGLSVTAWGDRCILRAMAILSTSNPIGVALAGGQSRRLGRDKALLRLPSGVTLLEHSLDLLRDAGLREVVISVSTSERMMTLREAVPALAGHRSIVDEQPNRGPLGALVTVLRAFPQRAVLLAACDLPHLVAAAPRLLLDRQNEADIIFPRVGGHDQQLLALYGPACLPIAVRLLAENRLAMRDLLAAPGLRVRVLDDADLARAGVPLTAFDNLNTPADLAVLLGQ